MKYNTTLITKYKLDKFINENKLFIEQTSERAAKKINELITKIIYRTLKKAIHYSRIKDGKRLLPETIEIAMSEILHGTDKDAGETISYLAKENKKYKSIIRVHLIRNRILQNELKDQFEEEVDFMKAINEDVKYYLSKFNGTFLNAEREIKEKEPDVDLVADAENELDEIFNK